MMFIVMSQADPFLICQPSYLNCDWSIEFVDTIHQVKTAHCSRKIVSTTGQARRCGAHLFTRPSSIYILIEQTPATSVGKRFYTELLPTLTDDKKVQHRKLFILFY